MAIPFQQADRFHWTWKDQFLTALVIVGLGPLALPMMLYDRVRYWVMVRRSISGTVEKAWEKCSRHWKQHGFVRLEVYRGKYNADESCLAVALGKAHRREAAFFLQQLHNPDPLLAGYAYYALTGARPDLDRREIPREVLHRKELVRAAWADMGHEEPLGSLLRDRIAGKDRMKHRKPESMPKWISYADPDYERIHCCGEQDLTFLHCSQCGHIWLECSTCETWFPDLSDLSQQRPTLPPRPLTPPGCPRCGKLFDRFDYLDHHYIKNYLPTPAQVRDAGHGHLLAWYWRETFAAEEE